jgi:hypothetical protein
MPKGIMYVESAPVSPDREAEYHKWYNEVHLPEILSVEGFVSARRFAPVDGNGPFVAIYEVDTDDLQAAAERLYALGQSGQMSSLELLNMNPPPVPRLYREIGSYPAEPREQTP